MKAQRELGVGDSRGKPSRNMRKVREIVDLASIDARERASLHDVKARIEEFNALAGRTSIFTSALPAGTSLKTWSSFSYCGASRCSG
jgi:adenylosuccinate lyase